MCRSAFAYLTNLGAMKLTTGQTSCAFKGIDTTWGSKRSKPSEAFTTGPSNLEYVRLEKTILTHWSRLIYLKIKVMLSSCIDRYPINGMFGIIHVSQRLFTKKNEHHQSPLSRKMRIQAKFVCACISETTNVKAYLKQIVLVKLSECGDWKREHKAIIESERT